MASTSDRERFTGLFDRWAPRVYAYARRHSDATTADDVVADEWPTARRTAVLDRVRQARHGARPAPVYRLPRRVRVTALAAAAAGAAAVSAAVIALLPDRPRATQADGTVEFYEFPPGEGTVDSPTLAYLATLPTEVDQV